MYEKGHYDLAGFSVGVVERAAMLPRPVGAGDVAESQPWSVAEWAVAPTGFNTIKRTSYEFH